MNKFIFVCYDHGCGGENLSVTISKQPCCNELEYEMHNTRTWTKDVFNKLLLKTETMHTWKYLIPEVPVSEKFYVVPSHIEPKKLLEVFPNAVYVVINFPRTEDKIKHLHNRIYEKVWLTSMDNIKQKIGFCKEYGYTIDSQEKLKQINIAVNNAHIHCIMNNLDFTQENVNNLLLQHLETCGMNYIDNDQIITMEYDNLDYKKLDRLNEICVLYRQW